jgi:hypothetical protein
VNVIFFLLDDSVVPEFYVPENSDARESPKRKNTTTFGFIRMWVLD